MSDTLSLTNNYVRRLFVLRTPAVQRDGLTIALSVHVVVVHTCTPPLNEEATASRLLEARSGRRSWPMYRWKFGFKPKTSLFSQQSFIDQNRRSIDQPNFGLVPNSLPATPIIFLTFTKIAPTTDIIHTMHVKNLSYYIKTKSKLRMGNWFDMGN